MDDQVKYVVTTNAWDKEFDEALSSNPELVFVGPEWVFECGRRKTIIPHQSYSVLPA